MRRPLTLLLLSAALFLRTYGQVPTDGLVLYYSFDNNATDKSPNHNDGQVLGGIESATDRFGNGCSAYHFDGHDGFISIPNSQSIQSIRNSMTVCTWFKIEKGDVKGNEARLLVFSKGSSSGDIRPAYHIQLLQSFGEATSTVNFSNILKGEDKNYQSHRIEYGQWYFFAITYDENWIQAYLNGKIIWQSLNNKTIVANDFPLEIGKDFLSDVKYFSGCMDEFRLYNRGLSAPEVAALFADESNKTPSTGVSVKTPGDMEIAVDKGKCTTTVSFTEPTASAGCGKVELKQMGGPANGSEFKIGISTMVYQATYADGQKKISTFNITVKDKEAPEIKCIADLQIKTQDPKGNTVDYPEITATDNCPNVKLERIAGPASGTIFPIGITTVKYEATDASGNKQECSFNVTVLEDVIPIVHCTKDISAFTTRIGKTVLVTYAEPSAEIKGKKILMTRKSGPASGTAFPVGNTEIIYTAHPAGSDELMCSFVVSVRDTIPPTFNCPHDIIVRCPEGQRSARVTFATPTATDGGSAVIVNRVTGSKGGEYFSVGETLVKYEAIDASGNKSECSFTVTVKEDIQPVLHCGGNIVAYSEADKNEAPVKYDEPYIDLGGSKIPMAIKKGMVSGSNFKVGETTVVYQALDAGLENQKCSFTITVKDTISPVIKCVNDINVTCLPGKITSIVNYPTPTASDHGVEIGVAFVTGLMSGQPFPVGVTEVKYRATDASGNTSTCSFNIRVTEYAKAEMRCTHNVVAYTTPDQDEAMVKFTEPYVDVKGQKTPMVLSTGAASGSKFKVGEHNISYVANSTDLAGQKCSFTVTVKDTIMPLIKCVRDITITCEADQKSAIVNYAMPSASDGGNALAVELVGGLKSGSAFPVGVTEVKYRASDPSGNMAVCSFKVTVERKVAAPEPKTQPIAEVKPEPKPQPKPEVKPEPKPEVKEEVKAPEKIKEEPAKKPDTKPVEPAKTVDVNCDAEILKLNDPGKCGATVNYNAPKGHGQMIQTSGKPSGSFFSIGTTVNNYSFGTSAGPRPDCSFRIKVKDVEKPVMKCPGDSTIILSQNRKGVIFTYVPPTAKDNCKADSVIQREGSVVGCFLPIGIHPFLFETKDSSGNVSSCAFTVTVKTNAEQELIAIPKKLDKTLGMGTDSIHYEHHVELDNCLLTVYIYDDGEEDGDTVSIIFDGQVIVNREMIKLKEHGPIKRQIVLLGGNQNYILAKAWNTGRVGLNTLKIEVYEGYIENDKRDLKNKVPIITKVMHSKPGDASGILLKCKW